MTSATRLSRFVLLLAVTLTCVGCDRATKIAAERYLEPIYRQSYESYLGDTLRVQYVENPGAFLGLGGSMSAEFRFWALVVVNAVLLLAVLGVLLLKWDMPRWKYFSLALLLSGGIGNLIDRSIRDGMVVDFLNVGIGPIRTGIFNVADMAITGGVILLIVLSWRDDSAHACMEST